MPNVKIFYSQQATLQKKKTLHPRLGTIVGWITCHKHQEHVKEWEPNFIGSCLQVHLGPLK